MSEEPTGAATLTGEGEGGAGEQPWLTSVPEDLRGHEVFKGMEKAGDVYSTLTQLHDKSKETEGMVKIPGEDAGDEERANFYKQLGRPDGPEGYQFEKPELPEGLSYNEELVQNFRTVAHELGLTDKQAKALHEFHNTQLAKSYEADIAFEKQEHENGMKALKEAWGGDYNKNQEIVVRTQEKLNEKLGGDELKNFLETYGAGDHPTMNKLLFLIGTAIADDKFDLGSPAGAQAEGGLSKMFPSMAEKK